MSDDSALPARKPWPYGGAIPERFSDNYELYQRQGGLVAITEDAAAFAGDKPLGDVARFVFFSLAFDQIHKEGIDGDIAELGVYQGSTAAILARHARRMNRRLFLMDTFEGFDQQDLDSEDPRERLQFSDTSIDAVRSRIGELNTVYIKGRFPKSAAQLPGDGRYCLVHIDADLYAPIISGLEYFYPRLVPGGFLIVHDYGSLCWPGAEKAIDTFFADKPEGVIQIPDGAGSMVIRRLRSPSTEQTWLAKQRRLPLDVWHSGAYGQLSIVLDECWSVAEPWGVWGLGKSHGLTLNTISIAGHPLAIDLDIQAFVWEGLASREVDVFVNCQPNIVLTFGKDDNRTIVSLAPVYAADDRGTLTIEFRPRTVAIPKKVNPLTDDYRPLGIGLHRIRIRSLDGT
jgi:Macrocin-O-methyltransferase (TylF)